MKKSLHYFIMCAIFSMIVFSASNTMAQSPKLDFADNMNSDMSAIYGGFLNSHWSQDYPYNQYVRKILSTIIHIVMPDVLPLRWDR